MTGALSGATAGYSGTPPAPVPTDSEIAAMDAEIASTESTLADIKSSNESQIQNLITKSKVLRKKRDEMQLQAWALLQGASYNRAKIEEALGDLRVLDEGDFDEFDPD